MTKLLEEALTAVRRLPPDVQDHVARAMLAFADSEGGEVHILTADEEAALALSEPGTPGGELADDEEVRAIWAKHGL
jgi:hypothetical protein